MTLLECQQQFASMVPRLIDKAVELGYAVTLGDAYRDPRVTYGHPGSLHRFRLAIDLNLFSGEDFLHFITDGEGHRELHEYWESIGGAKIIKGDSNHYSLQWQSGVR